MKIGLALAGGGIRGAAHIGAIKALEENVDINYSINLSVWNLFVFIDYSVKKME